MEKIGNLIDAKLMILVPVLFLLGMALKKSPVKDWSIPFLLAGAGTVLSFSYFAGLQLPHGWSEWLSVLFSSVTQGVLCASCSVYAKNLVKQWKERKQDEKTSEGKESKADG